MSKSGMKAAIEYGDMLRSFKDLSEAEDFFFTYKDILLKNLESISLRNALFTADYSVDSLTKIEKWYFDLYEKNEFSKIGEYSGVIKTGQSDFSRTPHSDSVRTPQSGTTKTGQSDFIKTPCSD